jgi:hypothetical protein
MLTNKYDCSKKKIESVIFSLFDVVSRAFQLCATTCANCPPELYLPTKQNFVLKNDDDAVIHLLDDIMSKRPSVPANMTGHVHGND